MERTNLLNVTKVVIKELIESSMKYGRMLDSDHIPLKRFFVVIEHVMRDGLKTKKGFLGQRNELWNVLERVQRFMPEATDITASVRDLPTVKTSRGRARAWLRLALMQKRLADYFRLLVDRKDEILQEYYVPEALMMCDEAVIIGGLLVGLNVIDCNLCVKEENLDVEQGIIDFSSYLHTVSQNGAPQADVVDPSTSSSMTAVLDQKNYIEELNRHLNATVTNLQQKADHLQASNALLKEELAAVKNENISLQEENIRLWKENESLKNGGSASSSPGASTSGANVDASAASSKEIPVIAVAAEPPPGRMKKMLQEENQKRLALEKELDLQVSLKMEAETAMKLLEKDMHEKQDTIISLRRQLEDIKAVSLQMYNKLKDCETSLKQKTEQISVFEQKNADMVTTISTMEAKLNHAEKQRVAAEETAKSLGEQLVEIDHQHSKVQSDLKIEKEWRISLQATVSEQNEEIAKLQAEVQRCRSAFVQLDKLRNEHAELQKKCTEYEEALGEMGIQLKETQLQLEDLRETSITLKDATWTDDKDATHCKQCNKQFSVSRRKHHCRNCGDIFCHQCSDNTMPLPSSAKPVRVCDNCHTVLLQRYTAK